MGDAVGSGFVATLARPEGNITGLSMQSPDLTAKRLQLIKEAAPNVSRLAVLADTHDKSYRQTVREAESAARTLGMQLRLHEVSSPGELSGAFTTMKREGVGAVLVVGGSMLYANRAELAGRAVDSRLPVMCPVRESVGAGCLMSYSPSLTGRFRRAAYFVDRILKGAKPADLPIEQPTTFELVINMKTAKAHGPDDPPIATVAGRSDHRVMKRRAFFGGVPCGLLAAPLAAEAQAGKIWRIGYLPSAAAENPPRVAFRQRLRELGYVEGQNVTFEIRSAEGNLERFPALAAELVRLNVDIIVAWGDPASGAAQKATTSIPIVMVAATDPIAAGFVASLAQPGGNITGLTTQSQDIAGKALQLLKETVPNLSRVAVLWDPASPGTRRSLAEVEAAATVLRLSLQAVEVRSPGELDGAFVAATEKRSGCRLSYLGALYIPTILGLRNSR